MFNTGLQFGEGLQTALIVMHIESVPINYTAISRMFSSSPQLRLLDTASVHDIACQLTFYSRPMLIYADDVICK